MHTVDNLVISCIDFRFRAKVAEWVKSELGDASDLAAIAGASKAILDEDTKASVLKQIDIASRLHAIKTVHILDHVDCGAYGGSGQFDSKEAEVEMHKTELEKAKKLIHAKFPGLEVKTYLLDFNQITAF